MLKFKEFSILLEKLSNNFEISAINEGGAYGHLNHPFEDMDLIMGDVLEMIQDTIEGAFSPENFVQEKTDGQNIMISWKAGKIIAARNKSHLKNYGENALDSNGISQLFAGRGDIEVAYNAAMSDLQGSIGELSESDKTRFFENGKKFLSLEIITPITQNTVPYGQNMLVFHGVLEYDESGSVIGEDKQAARDLGSLIKEANLSAQKTFFVRGPQDMDIKPLPNAKKRAAYYKSQYDKIIKDCSLTDRSTIYEYAMGMAKNVLLGEANKEGVQILQSAVDGLCARIADINKAYSVSMIKKELGKDAEWYIDLEKKKGKQLKRAIFAPLESLFLELGTEFMKNMSSFLSANPTEAAEAMKKEIDAAINTIKTTGGPTEIEKLEHELSRITAAGGIEGLVPTEGITFVFKGKLYKYTGIFAPLHQIRSMIAYKK